MRDRQKKKSNRNVLATLTIIHKTESNLHPRIRSYHCIISLTSINKSCSNGKCWKHTFSVASDIILTVYMVISVAAHIHIHIYIYSPLSLTLRSGYIFRIRNVFNWILNTPNINNILKYVLPVKRFGCRLFAYIFQAQPHTCNFSFFLYFSLLYSARHPIVQTAEILRICINKQTAHLFYDVDDEIKQEWQNEIRKRYRNCFLSIAHRCNMCESCVCVYALLTYVFNFD